MAGDKALTARMDSIVGEVTLFIAPNDTAYLQTEVALTNRFIQYYRNSSDQSLVRQLPLVYLIPAKKMTALAMADTVLHFNSYLSDSVAKPYGALKKELVKYDSIAKRGGWQPITLGTLSLMKGANNPLVSSIKKRLQLTGDYIGSDTTSKFNDSLEVAVRFLQERNGFDTDGIVTDSLLAILNVPVEQRIEQILINMNRMAWLPPEVKDNFVSVSMRVVVGKEGTNTMMFTGDLKEVVFSPEWNLPASIVKSEVLPAMKADPNYLKSKRMVVMRRNDSLPEIKQLSGPGNALGKVKFLFPNSYDIYLHDTEAKELFLDKKRAFSHGCIRLEDAEAMSGYVLRDNSAWTANKIRSAMNGSKPQSVAVKNHIPVVITYFTTWVDAHGQLQFRNDVYQQDKRTAAMMFVGSKIEW
jgi:murein L,D-transpeptidase YcbB/YkuD